MFFYPVSYINIYINLRLSETLYFNLGLSKNIERVDYKAETGRINTCQLRTVTKLYVPFTVGPSITVLKQTAHTGR